MSRSELFSSVKDINSASLSFVKNDKDRLIVILTARSQQSAGWMWTWKYLDNCLTVACLDKLIKPTEPDGIITGLIQYAGN